MSVFCIVYFSHGVYSPFMIGLCLFPLILGVVPMILRRRVGLKPASLMNRTIRMWGIITLTVASCLTGVFAIYGTVSAFTIYFWIMGALLMITSIVAYLKEV